MPSDHYVSRWQIANWVPPGSEQAKFFDFRFNTVRWKGPRGLFAKEGVNSTAAEKRLNELVETPLTQRGRTLLDPCISVESLDEKVRVALWLLWSLQPNRHRFANEAAGENLLERSDDELYQRCAQLEQSWQLSRLVVPEPVLALPDSGSFVLSNSMSPSGPLGVPVPDITWAVPVSPQVAFVAYPRGAQVRTIPPNALVTRSIGHIQQQVAIPPVLFDRMSVEQIRGAVLDSRQINLQVIRGMFEVGDELHAIGQQTYAAIFGDDED